MNHHLFSYKEIVESWRKNVDPWTAAVRDGQDAVPAFIDAATLVFQNDGELDQFVHRMRFPTSGSA